jgi:hypothetical protein
VAKIGRDGAPKLHDLYHAKDDLHHAKDDLRHAKDDLRRLRDWSRAGVVWMREKVISCDHEKNGESNMILQASANASGNASGSGHVCVRMAKVTEPFLIPRAETN